MAGAVSFEVRRQAATVSNLETITRRCCALSQVEAGLFETIRTLTSVRLPPCLEPGLYPQVRSFVLPEDAVHLRNLVQSEKAAPHNGWPRWTIMLAREVTAEFCDP